MGTAFDGKALSPYSIRDCVAVSLRASETTDQSYNNSKSMRLPCSPAKAESLAMTKKLRHSLSGGPNFLLNSIHYSLPQAGARPAPARYRARAGGHPEVSNLEYNRDWITGSTLNTMRCPASAGRLLIQLRPSLSIEENC